MMSKLLEFICESQPDFRGARLPSLYSDFSGQRLSNPDGYAANVAAWESALLYAAKSGRLDRDRLSMHMGTRLESQLQSPQYGRPQGLGVVEDELVAQGKAVSLREYLQSDTSIHNHGWNMTPGQIPAKVFTWVLQQAGVLAKVCKDQKHQYVLLLNLEIMGNEIIDRLALISRRVDRIIPIRDFRDIVSNVLSVEQISDIDLAVMLKYLSRDKGVIATDAEVVKVKNFNENAVHLEQEDRQICSLKTIIADLQRQVDSISQKIDALQLKAKEAVGKKNRAAALSALRSKRMHEELLVKRNESLTQLENVFHKIEEAADNLEVIKAMEGSTAVLKSLNKRSGGIDRVDQILDDLREEMAQADEVGSAITDHGASITNVHESEIDDELREMEANSKSREQNEQDDITDDLIKRLDDLKIPGEQTTGEKESAVLQAVNS